jgi:hypothetical protein
VFSRQTALGNTAKKADGRSFLRVKSQEREIEEKVLKDALVKKRSEGIIRAASKIFTEQRYQVAMIRDILLKGKN